MNILEKNFSLSSFEKPWAIFLVLLACFTVYSFMLSAPFKTLDDEFTIEKNPHIRSFTNLKTIFRSSYFGGDAYYRPLVTFTYMIEYHFFGLNPVFYNFTNLILHMITTFSVFLLICLLLGEARMALGVALLFAIHPIHWEAVANIAGRSILLCGLLIVNAFFFYCLFEKSTKKIYYVFSLLFFGLALLSKEAAAVCPLVIFTYRWLLSDASKFPLRNFLKPIIPFFAMVGIYVLWRHTLGITKFFYWRNMLEGLLGFLSFLRSVFTNVRLFVLPIDLHFDRMRKLFLQLNDPELMVTVAAIIFLIILWTRFRQHISITIKFFIAWSLIELLPVSQILVSVGVQPGYISTAEHFLYLPSIGFFVILIFGAQHLYAKTAPYVSRPVMLIAITGYFIFLFLTTVEQNIYATHEMAMFERTLKINPANSRIRNSLALSYAKEKDFKKAEKHFRLTVEYDPYNTRARIGLGKSLHDQGRYFEAMQEYEKIEYPEGFEKLIHENLTATYNQLIEGYKKRINHEPENARLYYSLGVIYTKKKETQAALEQYEKAVSLDANFKEAIFNLATAYAIQGENNMAIVFYERVINLSGPKDSLDYVACMYLPNLYRQLGDEVKANYYFELAKSLKGE